MHLHASCMHAQVVFMCTHSCSSIHYEHMPQHAYTCKSLHTHVGTQKPHFLSSLIFFSRLFSLSNHDSYAPFQPLLQVLLPFMSRGCTSRISSWYMALTKDTKALVHTVGFELVILLLPEGFASGILV